MSIDNLTIEESRSLIDKLNKHIQMLSNKVAEDFLLSNVGKWMMNRANIYFYLADINLEKKEVKALKIDLSKTIVVSSDSHFLYNLSDLYFGANNLSNITDEKILQQLESIRLSYNFFLNYEHTK